MSDPTPPLTSTPDYYPPVQVWVVHPPKQRYWLHALLLLATFSTTLVVGAHMEDNFLHNLPVLGSPVPGSDDDAVSFFPAIWALEQPSRLLLGLPFSCALMLILLAHEMGHYLYCKHYGVYATLPFFIPAPTLIGTLGAFIRIRSPIRSRRALFDVGASGPFVGFALALPALVYGVLHAKVVPALATDGNADLVFGVPLLLKLMAVLFRPHVDAAQLLLHPVGRAAWVGIFATALNLLPVGQLDGGHIVRSMSARAHRAVSLALPALLCFLGIISSHIWLLWAAILLGLRFFRLAPIYDPTPLDSRRKFGTAMALIVFLLCFMPKPL